MNQVVLGENQGCQRGNKIVVFVKVLVAFFFCVVASKRVWWVPVHVAPLLPFGIIEDSKRRCYYGH